jgi:hypothetical protein
MYQGENNEFREHRGTVLCLSAQYRPPGLTIFILPTSYDLHKSEKAISFLGAGLCLNPRRIS